MDGRHEAGVGGRRDARRALVADLAVLYASQSRVVDRFRQALSLPGRGAASNAKRIERRIASLRSPRRLLYEPTCFW